MRQRNSPKILLSLFCATCLLLNIGSNLKNFVYLVRHKIIFFFLKIKIFSTVREKIMFPLYCKEEEMNKFLYIYDLLQLNKKTNASLTDL